MKINYLFIPINFILKRFNYLIVHNWQYFFNKDNFTSNIYGEKISLYKIKPTANEKYSKVIKEYIIYKKIYGNNN